MTVTRRMETTDAPSPPPPPSPSPTLIEMVIALVLAESAKRTAASGSDTTGNGWNLLQQVKFYKMGVQHQIPVEWAPFVLMLDPEYAEYLRLVTKFQ